MTWTQSQINEWLDNHAPADRPAQQARAIAMRHFRDLLERTSKKTTVRVDAPGAFFPQRKG